MDCEASLRFSDANTDDPVSGAAVGQHSNMAEQRGLTYTYEVLLNALGVALSCFRGAMSVGCHPQLPLSPQASYTFTPSIYPSFETSPRTVRPHLDAGRIGEERTSWYKPV